MTTRYALQAWNEQKGCCLPELNNHTSKRLAIKLLRPLLAALLLAVAGDCLAQHALPAPSGSAMPQPEPVSIEQEVLANIQNQRVGGHTVGDFNLPPEFLRRVADRIIRSSFEQHLRIVVRDIPEEAAHATALADQSAEPAMKDADQPGVVWIAVGLGGVVLCMVLFVIRRRGATK